MLCAHRTRGHSRVRHTRPRRSTRQLGRENAGRGSAVLERGRVVIKLDQLGKGPFNLIQQRKNGRIKSTGDIMGNPARDDAIHHQPVPETGISRSQDPLAQDAALRMHEGE